MDRFKAKANVADLTTTMSTTYRNRQAPEPADPAQDHDEGGSLCDQTWCYIVI